MNKKKLSLILIIVIVVCSIGIVYELIIPVDSTEERYFSFEVKEGESSFDIVNNLAADNIVRDRYSTYMLSALKGNNYYANDYVLSKSMNVNQILNILMQPTTNVNQKNGLVLTIIEGDNINSIAQNIADNSLHTKKEVLELWNDDEYLQTLIDEYWFIPQEILDDEVIQPMEGLFTPSTYFFTKDEDLKVITESLLDNSEVQFAPYKDIDYEKYNFYDALTLASIIERETNNSTDQYLVSGVYHNRLDLDMMLQADITVLYAKQKHKNIVTYEDLEFDSPYNLYKNTGLTPSPIASPSINALDAAIYPEINEYLYYYNTPGTGETIYSKTYKQHQKVVSQYQ